jgi:16S rRNA (cytosine967-C5)-methyltransferase
LGIENLTTHLQDGTEENPAWLDAMDVVLCDVPCSGYGIIRKKPDIRYKDPDTMKDLPELQLQILRQQAKYVKKGGTLLYSTCTLLHRENRDVVRKFLCERDDFCLEPLPLPEHIPEDAPGMLTLIPGKYDTDGFFICRLRRKV